MVAFASVANKQKHTIFHLHFPILKRRDGGGGEGEERGWGERRRGGGGESERGHPGRHFGVRDMLADVWSRLMETTVACSPPRSLLSHSRWRGGGGGVMDVYTEEEEEGDEGEIQEDAVPAGGR